MYLPLGPRRFISRRSGARNAVEGEELLQRMPTCRGLDQVAALYSNGTALEKSAHFRLPMPVCDYASASRSPALASFAELTEAGRH